MCVKSNSGTKSGCDKQNMPEIGMNGQDENGIVQAARICKNGDSAQKTETHKEGQACLMQPAFLFVCCKGKKQQKVHGNAAELEGKIPPVVCSVVDEKGKTELLGNFGCEHENCTDTKESVQENRGNRR